MKKFIIDKLYNISHLAREGWLNIIITTVARQIYWICYNTDIKIGKYF